MAIRKKTISLIKWSLAASLVLIVPKPQHKLLQAKPSSAYTAPEALNLAHFKNLINPALVATLERKLPNFLPRAHTKIITVIDFSLPSTTKRLWTISLETGEVLYHTLVAHGQKTGVDMAENFSNKPESHQSSLGFYLTDSPYIGKHGKSLRLRGLEPLNDKAYDRAIVVHGADYVSESFIEKHGRLGRSHGCPAIPMEITSEFIETVKEGSLLFIYHPEYATEEGKVE